MATVTQLPTSTHKDTFKASHIANYILARAEQERIPITPMKLNKLVYFAYGWVLALLNRKIFEESIEAWRYGPVVPSLYHEFKHFGGTAIKHGERAHEFDPFSDDKPVTPMLPENDPDLLVVLDKVWNLYKAETASTLMQLTHLPETPWSQSYDGQPCTPISDDKIKGYFLSSITKLVANDGTR